MEHLKIGGYELLLRTARHANDSETAELCERILSEERGMAERLASNVDLSVQATLQSLGT